MNFNFDHLSSFEEFKGLKEETYILIEQCARIQNVPSKGMLLFEKQDSDYVYYVLSGIISIYKINGNGQRKIIFMFGKGNYLNEDYQANYNSVVSAQAYEDSLLLCIPKEIFYRMMENDSVFMKHVYSSVSKKLRRVYRQLNNMEVRLDKKIASKLYKLAKDYGVSCARGIFINMNLSVTYLSDLMGARRESVSRALKVLVDENLIIQEKKSFIVRDLNELADYFKKSK